MRALIQRVSRASISVDQRVVAAIGPGLLVLLGVRGSDTERDGTAAPRELAEPLYERFCDRLEARRGVFGAAMAVELVGDGPVTLLVESR